MSVLRALLEGAGLQYFQCGDEYMLVFRGAVLDHYILLRQGEAFVHATCVFGRVPSPLPSALAERLLGWNGGHSLSRIAISDGELVLLADLPHQGVDAHSVEQLVLSIATAAEQLKPQLLPLLLDHCSRSPLVSTDSPGPTARNEAAPAGQKGDTSRAVDPDIDWEAEDI